MRRATIALVAVGLMVATALAATGRSGAGPEGGAGDHLFVRWDLVQFVGNVILVGGTNVSTDQETGDTVTLTGSGHTEPFEREAAGGGRFVHRNAEGQRLARGAYYVTDFIGWRRLAGGSLDETGLIDGIGNGPGANPNEHEPTSGVLRLKIHLVPVVNGVAQPGVDGILIVFCHLPGTFEDVPEGIELKIPSLGLDFMPTSGVTLFHRLR